MEKWGSKGEETRGVAGGVVFGGPSATSAAVEYSDQPYVLEHPKMAAIRKNSNGRSGLYT